MPTKPSIGRICIVANELPHLFRNGGIGTHNWLLAEALAEAGWNVHVLYCAEVQDWAQLTYCRRLWNAKGITLWHLSEFASPAEDAPPCGLIGWLDWHSLHIRRALEQLDTQHQFDLIEFAEWSGYGFRTVQAHTMGTALTGPRIIVKLHASSQWCRDGNRQWLAGVDDLIRDYFERYSFEHADYQLSPSRYMLEYAAGVGWKVRDDARVVPYRYPQAPEAKCDQQEVGPYELVFFGRLESRKGLQLFLEVAKELPPEIHVAFVGRETPVDGMPAGELVAQTLAGRPFTMHTALDRHEALAYLSAGRRVAVMPSLVENYPFTVLECAVNGIPFLAANVGGIPEIVAGAQLREALLFEPTRRGLRQRIEAYLATDLATRQFYAVQMQEICNSERNLTTVCNAYAEMLPRRTCDSMNSSSSLTLQSNVEQVSAANARERPLVSIVVPYFNLGQYLPATLDSLAAQDYARMQVIVVNDGSTDAFSLEVWEQMQSEYPQFQFLTQENQGLGASRNTGLHLAQGEYFLPVDADNIAQPYMVSRFVEALERNSQLSVATCFHLAFEETADIRAGRFVYAYRPFGGPFVVAAVRNVYGDANAMFRTAALRSMGGYSTDRDLGYEDWEMYVQLVRHGCQIGVVPEYLFYYRHRPTSMLRTTDNFLNRRRVLRQFFSAAELPQAEQIGLWTALASLGEGQHTQQAPVAVAIKKKSVGRKAVREVKRVLRKAPYYAVVSGKLKQFKRRAA